MANFNLKYYKILIFFILLNNWYTLLFWMLLSLLVLSVIASYNDSIEYTSYFNALEMSWVSLLEFAVNIPWNPSSFALRIFSCSMYRATLMFSRGLKSIWMLILLCMCVLYVFKTSKFNELITLLNKVVSFLYLKFKILKTTELIEFLILRKLCKGSKVVFFEFKTCNGFKLYFCLSLTNHFK